jgi:hypothetical protein
MRHHRDVENTETTERNLLCGTVRLCSVVKPHEGADGASGSRPRSGSSSSTSPPPSRSWSGRAA